MKMTNWLRDVFSFSKLMTFSKCPRMAFYRYVVRTKTDAPQPWLLYGRGVHAGQEADNLAKLRGEALSVPQVLDIAVEAYKAEGGTAIDDFASEHAAQLERYDASGARASIRPLPRCVEAPFSLEVSVSSDPDTEPASPATIEGFVDVISQEAPASPRTVIDYKTSARPTKPSEPAADLQLALYQLAGQAPDARVVNFLRYARQHPTTKISGPAALTPSRLQRLRVFLSDTIAAFRRALKSGDWPKCSPTCHWCSSSTCDFYDRFCYPKDHPGLDRFISLGTLTPVGEKDAPDWRTKK